MKSALDALRIIYTAVAVLVMGNEQPGNGAEKRAAVVTQALAIIDEPGGIEVPAWLRGILPTLLPILVDLIVAQLNRLGFLQPSAAS